MVNIEHGACPMKPIVFLAGVAFLGFASVTSASAAGCLKGAAIGGVAGHMAGHGGIGAAAGCAVGHHKASKKSKAAPAQQSNQSATPSSGDAGSSR